MKLSILVCTFNDRIRNVLDLLLPPSEQVEYVVSFQYTDEMFLAMIPTALKEREDVKLVPHFGSGLSANRNHALRHCTTEYALLADDDVRYTPESLSKVIASFEEHPEVDILLFQAMLHNGEKLKRYPTHEYDYSQRPRGSYVSSVEIALRTDAPYPAFDTRFGLGSAYLSCGEEEVWLHQAWRQGARIRYLPYPLCSIPVGETTGRRFLSDVRVRRSKGATLYMMHGMLGSLLRISKAAVLLPSSTPRWQCWRDMLDGILYIYRHPLNEGAAQPIPIDFQPIEDWKHPLSPS
ncbi:MAG: glycosyltransferase family 2 protein [Bacteroidales bacterium]|nr:glycosyltransferase family 2 protein [Bacteroidales bacterium]